MQKFPTHACQAGIKPLFIVILGVPIIPQKILLQPCKITCILWYNKHCIKEPFSYCISPDGLVSKHTSAMTLNHNIWCVLQLILVTVCVNMMLSVYVSTLWITVELTWLTPMHSSKYHPKTDHGLSVLLTRWNSLPGINSPEFHLSYFWVVIITFIGSVTETPYIPINMFLLKFLQTYDDVQITVQVSTWPLSRIIRKAYHMEKYHRASDTHETVLDHRIVGRPD